jgi:hypothetical protein
MKAITNSATKKRDKPLLKLIFLKREILSDNKGYCSFIRILVGWEGKWGWVIKVGFVKFVHVPHNFWQAGDFHFLLIVSLMNKIEWLSPSLLKGTKYFHEKRSTAFSVLWTYVITAEHNTQAADCSYLETHVRLVGAFSKLWKTSNIFQVCPSAWNNSAPTKQIFMKFDIWAFFENLSRKLVSLKSGKNNRHFTCRQTYICDHISFNSS